jgi:uncharacterized membrane protein
MTPHLTQHPLAPAPSNDLLLASCAVALATLVPVALYQTGIIANLPDPPFALFDSETITSSKIAHPLGIPDALLGLASFGFTLALAVCAQRNPTARKALGAKLALDGSMAVFKAGRQMVSFGKLCSWCTATALAAAVMVYAGRQTIADSGRDAATQAKRLLA